MARYELVHCPGCDGKEVVLRHFLSAHQVSVTEVMSAGGRAGNTVYRCHSHRDFASNDRQEVANHLWYKHIHTNSASPEPTAPIPHEGENPFSAEVFNYMAHRIVSLEAVVGRYEDMLRQHGNEALTKEFWSVYEDYKQGR